MLNEVNFSAVEAESDERQETHFESSLFANTRGTEQVDVTLAPSPLPAPNEESACILTEALIDSSVDKAKNRDLDSQLERTMASPEIRAVSLAVDALAQDQNISAQEAANRLFASVDNLRQVWNGILVREGLAALRNGH